MWDVEQGKCLICFNFGRPIASLAFHAAGNYLAVASGHKVFCSHKPSSRDDTGTTTRQVSLHFGAASVKCTPVHLLHTWNLTQTTFRCGLSHIWAVCEGSIAVQLYMWEYAKEGAQPMVVLKTRRSLRAVHFQPHGIPLLLTAEVHILCTETSVVCSVQKSCRACCCAAHTPDILLTSEGSSLAPSGFFEFCFRGAQQSCATD